MTRPNFSVTIPGAYKRSSNTVPQGSVYAVPSARFATESCTGVSRRKPKGWIPPTGYYFQRRAWDLQFGIRHLGYSKTVWTKAEGYVGVSGAGFNGLNYFDQCLTESTAFQRLGTSAALVAARNKLRNKKVDLGVAFAERKQTAQLLGGTARTLATAVRELQRGNFRNAARALGVKGNPGRPRGSNWTNHWLQLQYGWKPALSDVYGAVDALSKRPLSDWRVTAKAYRGDLTYYLDYALPQGSASGLDSEGSHWCTAERKRGVFVRIDAIPENDLTMSLSALGVTNPALILWERMPYSFVVDWALPVGKWLESLDALLGFGPAWTSISTRNEAKWVDDGLSKSWSQYVFNRQTWHGNKEVKEVNRTASSGVPLPAFPSFKDPRSLGHMANGLALLSQVFGR